MNNCNGNGAFDLMTGMCTCNAGWVGADCGLMSTLLNADDIVTCDTTGPGWCSWYYKKMLGPDAMILKITSNNNPIDVYMSFAPVGEPQPDPNQYNF